MVNLIYTLLLLVIVLIILILAIDLDYKKKLKKYTSKYEIILKDIVQEMLDIMSLDIKASDKIENLNEVFLDKFDIIAIQIILNVIASKRDRFIRVPYRNRLG